MPTIQKVTELYTHK